MLMTLHRIFTGISPDNSSITWYSCCCSELPNHLSSPHNLFLIEHQLCGLWLVPESVRPSTLIYILQGYKVPIRSFVELNFSFEKQRPSLRSITGSRIWTNGMNEFRTPHHRMILLDTQNPAYTTQYAPVIHSKSFLIKKLLRKTKKTRDIRRKYKII